MNTKKIHAALKELELGFVCPEIECSGCKYNQDWMMNAGMSCEEGHKALALRTIRTELEQEVAEDSTEGEQK